jgi:hypothetical protein
MITAFLRVLTIFILLPLALAATSANATPEGGRGSFLAVCRHPPTPFRALARHSIARRIDSLDSISKSPRSLRGMSVT